MRWTLGMAMAAVAAMVNAESAGAGVAEAKPVATGKEQVREVAVSVDGNIPAERVAHEDKLMLANASPSKETRERTKTSLRCRMCGAHLAWKHDYHHLPRQNKAKAKSLRQESSLGEEGEIVLFDGPLGDEFELASFEESDAIASDNFTEEDTFFDEYNWRVLTCPRCARHVGWKFTHQLQEQCMTLAKDYLTPSAQLTAPMTKLKATVEEAFASQKCHVMANGWWSYQVCYKSEVRQYHEEADGSRPWDWSMGRFSEDRSNEREIIHHYTGGQHCDENGQARSTSVKYVCCAEQPEITVDTIDEPSLCQYNIRVCVPTLCDPSATPDANNKKSLEEKKELEETCKGIVSEAEPSTLPQFYTLMWPDTIADDSKELDWAKSLTTITSIGR